MCFGVPVSELLALPGFIVAVLAILIGGLIAVLVPLYVHRREFPRREFTYRVHSSPIVPKQIHGIPKLGVVYDGSTLQHPYLVTIEVASTGRADISSTSFDGQKPILFELNAPVLVEIEQVISNDAVSAELKSAPGQARVVLVPAFLPKDLSIRGTYLCDGEPTPKVRAELVDIIIRDGSFPKSTKTYERTMRRLVTAVGGTGGIVAILAVVQQLTGSICDVLEHRVDLKAANS